MFLHWFETYDPYNHHHQPQQRRWAGEDDAKRPEPDLQGF